MTNEISKHINKIEQAEDLLTEVFWDIRDERGFSKEAKRLDTILAKVYELKHVMYQKQKRR